jgi:FkbM family methyltransferase
MYRRGLRFGVGAAIEHRSVAFEHEFATVLDVGSHRGQFALFAARRFPNALIFCFEPLSRAAGTLKHVLPPGVDARVFNVALGASAGTAELHVPRDDDASSLLPIERDVRGVVTKEVRSSRVPVARLDELLDPSEIRAPSLLKIDVQGYELEVLRGSEKLLPLISEILVECSFDEFYAGQALADDVVAYLRDRGFRLSGVFSLLRDGCRCLQGDFLFVRRDGWPTSAEIT